MYQADLFFGLHLEENLLQRYSTIPAEKRDLFIQDHEEYLHEVKIDGQLYLGKKLGKMTSLKSLEMTEKNVLTLLSKIFPQEPIEAHQLALKPLFSSA